MKNKGNIYWRVVVITMACLFFQKNFAQQYSISGTIHIGNEPAQYATVQLQPGNRQKFSNENGFFRFTKLYAGNYTLIVSQVGYKTIELQVLVTNKNKNLDISFSEQVPTALTEVVVTAGRTDHTTGKLKDVVGTAIYAGKKTEVIYLKNINGNLATNNTRQIYARIAGLNIWEYDRGGLQLGIGGRGLSPNRSSNFNIRQNGSDISADALGYPESYYTPSAEALDKIEIIRGAASLQYGPHFGGLINFKMKEGPREKPVEITLRNTLGSYGFANSFNSIGGTIAKNKLNYYSFYQYKQGDDWRPNSHYHQHNAYIQLAYDVSDKLKITGNYTFMKYLAQQPGGLTDAQFAADPSVSVRARNWFAVNWNLIGVNVDYKINNNTSINWRNFMLLGGREALGILSYINRADLGGNRDLMADRYSNVGSELRFIHQYSFLNNPNNTFLIGTRYYQGLTNRKQGDGSKGSDADFAFAGPEPNKSAYKFPGNNVAVFAENIFQINKQWSITPGIRFEYINTKSNGYYYKDLQFIPDEKIAEKNTNPRQFALLGIGSSYKIKNGIELYANISQNYRSINFNDVRVVNQNARVDSTIKDEQGYNVDMGMRGNYKNWLYVDISLFYLKYNNRIGSIFKAFDDGITRRYRTNVSDSRNLGLEFLVEGDLLKPLTQFTSKYKLNLYANFSAIDARYIHSKDRSFEDKLVENVPPFLFRTGFSFGNPRFNITYQFSHQAKQYSDATNAEETPTAVDGAIPAFYVMDISTSYNWRIFSLYAGMNNVTDSKYFTRRADGYPGPGIIPADKRNLYITLQIKL